MRERLGSFAIGDFRATVDFGDGLVDAEGVDVAVVSLDAGGATRWVRRYGSTFNDRGWGIDVNTQSRIFLSGWVAGPADFGGGPIGVGGRDAFVACLDDGDSPEHRWSQAFGDSGDAWGVDVVADPEGNTFVVGSFAGVLSLGGDEITSVGGLDGFVARFGPTGLHQWSHRFGGPMDDGAPVIPRTATRALVAGVTFYETADFAGTSLTSRGRLDFAVLALAPDGVRSWIHHFGGTGHDWVFGLGASSLGPLYVGGRFADTIDFGAGAETSQGSFDAYVLRLD